jgi:hypothetical protein
MAMRMLRVGALLARGVCDRWSQGIDPFLYPPEGDSAGFRQRSMKTHSGAVGVDCQPAAHDDNMAATDSATITKAMYVFIALSHSRLRSWRLLRPPAAILPPYGLRVFPHASTHPQRLSPDGFP